MIVVKPIKPSRFNEKAIFDALSAESERIANDILLDFELTTTGWEHKVKFEKIVEVGAAAISIFVSTDDEIYGYVNNGTVPHKITAKNGKTLAFPSTYSAKTSPGKMTSSKGGSSGSTTVFAASVNHPGTEARAFDAAIQKDWKPKMRDRLQLALRVGAEKSGHAME